MTLTFASFQRETSSVLFPKKRKRYLATQTVTSFIKPRTWAGHTLIFSQVQQVLSHTASPAHALTEKQSPAEAGTASCTGPAEAAPAQSSCCYQGCHRKAPGGGDPQQMEQISIQGTWKPPAHTLEEDWPGIKVHGMLPVCVWSPAPSRYLWLNPLVLPPSISQIQSRALYSKLVSTSIRQITRIISLFPFQITALLEA